MTDLFLYKNLLSFDSNEFHNSENCKHSSIVWLVIASKLKLSNTYNQVMLLQISRAKISINLLKLSSMKYNKTVDIYFVCFVTFGIEYAVACLSTKLLQ